MFGDGEKAGLGKLYYQGDIKFQEIQPSPHRQVIFFILLPPVFYKSLLENWFSVPPRYELWRDLILC